MSTSTTSNSGAGGATSESCPPLAYVWDFPRSPGKPVLQVSCGWCAVDDRGRVRKTVGRLFFLLFSDLSDEHRETLQQMTVTDQTQRARKELGGSDFFGNILGWADFVLQNKSRPVLTDGLRHCIVRVLKHMVDVHSVEVGDTNMAMMQEVTDESVVCATQHLLRLCRRHILSLSLALVTVSRLTGLCSLCGYIGRLKPSSRLLGTSWHHCKVTIACLFIVFGCGD